MVARMLAHNFIWVGVLGLLLFVPAGRLDWIQAWTFLALILLSGLLIGFWLAKHDPALLAERMKPVGLSEIRPWDRLYMTVLLVGMHAWFAFMGWEARAPSPWPLWANVVGAVLVTACMWIAWVTFRVNSFAAATVRIQAERGQTVIRTGPYAIVRHPLYAGAFLWMVGMPMMIGTPYDLLGSAAVMVLVGARAVREERMLASDLPGYAAYMREVRFRLLPGVW